MDGLNLQLPVGAPLSIATLLFNLGVGVVLALLLRWHFERFGSTLTNRMEFAQVFPFILLTTVLIITVVKSSLALSLGLVGALSIVRFRTPIKEPEELAYLFLAIGVGLGLGANEPGVTLVMFTGILLYMGLMSARTSSGLPPRLLVHVSAKLTSGGAEETLQKLLAEVERDAPRVDLRRVDTEGDAFEATLVLDLQRADQIGTLISRIQAVVPSGSVSVVEGSSLD